MKHLKQFRVYYQDTDAYKVVWHGAYLRYMEASRVDFCENIGLFLNELQQKGIVFPVVDLKIRYKASALLDDILTIETSIIEVKSPFVIFNQIIRNQNGKENVNAIVKIVVVDENRKLLRKIPEDIVLKFQNVLEKGNC